MNWGLVGLIFSALARATTRENVSPGIPEALDALTALINSGEATEAQLNALNQKVNELVRDDRPPTEGEFAELFARSDDAHDIIQNADLSGDDAPQE